MPNSLSEFGGIGIAGIGLIGGSFAGAFYNQGVEIYGFDLNPAALSAGAASEWFEGLTDEFDRFIKFPLDIIYICLPVSAAIDFINRLGKAGYKGAVTDACSVKSSVVEHARNNGLLFCGGHPIKGKETSGFNNADASLFSGAKHILTPHEENGLTEPLKRLHTSIGMDVRIMDASCHDKIFADISHLPHLISFCLMDTVASLNKEALQYAGGGFLDFTRIAASDPIMWKDIFLDNRDAILKSAENLEKDIAKWKRLIIDGNGDTLLELLKKVSGDRRNI